LVFAHTNYFNYTSKVGKFCYFKPILLTFWSKLNKNNPLFDEPSPWIGVKYF
jgi:hypothetical protein